MTDPSGGDCVNPRCSAGQRDDQPALSPLCPACLNSSTAAIPQLVYDYRDLEQQLPRHPTQRLDGQPGRSADTPAPLRVDVEALQRTIWWTTTTWAEILTDNQRLSTPSWHKRTRNGWAVQWACGVIAPRTTTLAALPAQILADYPIDHGATRHKQIALSNVDGAQGLLDLAWLHERARSMLGLTRLTRQLPGHCQTRRCGRELYQENGSDTVHCSAGHTMTRDDYEAYGNVFLRSAA